MLLQVTEKKLLEIFKMAGNVLHVELKVDKEGKSRGMGTVRMEHPLEALQAISMFNGQILYERAMSVRMDKMADSGQQVMPNKLPSRFIYKCLIGKGTVEYKRLSASYSLTLNLIHVCFPCTTKVFFVQVD